MNANIIAAIDIGTNSAHLLIGRFGDRHLEELDSDKVTIRLGTYLDENKDLTDEGCQQIIETIERFKCIATTYDPVYRAVATHAMRIAKNRDDVISRIKSKTGIAIEVIEGVEEARLTALGVEIGLSLSHFLSVDIGGGSTEITYKRDHIIPFISSKKVGSLILAERFFDAKNDFCFSAKDIMKLEAYVEQQFQVGSFDGLPSQAGQFVISSGTAKALVECALYTKKEKVKDLNGYALTDEMIANLYQKFCSLGSGSKIQEAFDLRLDRAQIITAGTAIIHILTKKLHVKKWLLSSYALREGLVVDTTERLLPGGTGVVPSGARMRSIEALGEQCHVDTRFAKDLVQLVIGLYNNLRSGGFFCPDSPEFSNHDLLAYSAYLVECGRFINYSQNHKHGEYLILHARLLGFTQRERVMLSLVVRHHRKRLFDSTDSLSTKDGARIKILSGILRLGLVLMRSRREPPLLGESHLNGGVWEQTVVFGYAPHVATTKWEKERDAICRALNLDVQIKFLTS